MSYKKTIIHLINSKIYSGLESVACDIINNLNDYNHIYVTQNGPIIDILKEKNIKYEIISKMSITELRRVIRKYNADIIHAHDFTASCISAMSLTRKTIISHLHHNAPWLRKINFKTLLYLICSFRFKKIFTVSKAIEKEFIFSKIIKKKIVCIFNPVSVEKIISNVEKIDYEKKYDICCVGRLTKAKDPIRWLEIINCVQKRFPNLKAIWVGDGEDKKLFLDKINELKLENTVNLIGFKKNPYKYIASSKIYLLTSSWEGFGLSAFEAISLGLPSVVSNVGGLPSIINNKCGYVCDSDDKFIDGVIECLSNIDTFNEKSKNAIERAKEFDNSKYYYKNIDEIYINVIEGR